MAKRSPTTKDIGLLRQLHDQGQLVLAPEFQRNGVWPRTAKAYLIDTILNDRPIPLFFMQRVSSAQTGRPGYAVIDGQQRLRAIFEFQDDRFKLTQSDKSAPWYNKKFSELTSTFRDAINEYDLVVQELTGYGETDIKDIFVRMNRYVVKLSPQELRHAKESGKFVEFVERIAKWDVWRQSRIISAQQFKRMRAVEFVAELTILLIEGPQDKKASIDLYYGRYREKFQRGHAVEALLRQYIKWINDALPTLSEYRYRSPTDFYSLIGALHRVSNDGETLSKVDPKAAGQRLKDFAAEIKSKSIAGEAARYMAAASRQTDNLQPRMTRIEVLSNLLKPR
jgi:hypothetical protein